MDKLLLEMTRNMKVESEEQLQNANTTQNAKRIAAFTNRDVVIEEQMKFLTLDSKLFKASHQSFKLFEIKSTITGRLPSAVGSSVNLSSENLIGIETLTKNAGKVLSGKFFLCRSITPPYKMTSIQIAMEDPEGKLAVRLALYNYTDICDQLELEQILPVGIVLAIKNPWFKPTMDGGFSVRCDNPADVEIITPQRLQFLFPNLKWQSKIPLEFRNRAISAAYDSLKTEHDDRFEKLKNLGNKSFVEKHFVDAIRFYTQAAEIAPSTSNAVVLANRGAAYLNIGCYKRAMEDLTAVMKLEPFHVKGIYRMVRTLWGCQHYSEALKFLNSKLTENPLLLKQKELMKLKYRAENIIIEHSTGKFDILDIFTNKKEVDVLDIADYTGPVTLQETSGKGRGLFALKAIQEGQTLIVSKAFSIYKSSKFESGMKINMNLESTTINLEGHAEHVALIAQKLRMEPELGQEFYKLYAGPEMESLNDDSEDIDKVDMNRIEKIIIFNAFSHKDRGATSIKEKESQGIWLLPSYVNHSCLDANCTWSIIGDTMFIRSVKPIQKGEEILISYMCAALPFDERQRLFRSHAFTCDCLLCKLDAEETNSTKMIQNEIFEVLQQERLMIISENGPRKQLIRSKMSELVSTQEKCPSLNYHVANEVVFQIAQALFENGYPEDCADILEMGYRVLKNIGAMADKSLRFSINILGSYVVQQNDQKVIQWTENVKRDLLIVFGTTEMMQVYGVSTLGIMNNFGYKFFD